MSPTRAEGPPPEKRLGILAMQFRGTRNQEQRADVAEEYARTVQELIGGEKWDEIPALEDQFPDEWMPEAFFAC